MQAARLDRVFRNKPGWVILPYTFGDTQPGDILFWNRPRDVSKYGHTFIVKGKTGNKITAYQGSVNGDPNKEQIWTEQSNFVKFSLPVDRDENSANILKIDKFSGLWAFIIRYTGEFM